MIVFRYPPIHDTPTFDTAMYETLDDNDTSLRNRHVPRRNNGARVYTGTYTFVKDISG